MLKRSEQSILYASREVLFSVPMDDPTFDEFAAFVREYWDVPRRRTIAPETQFERDLGLTGDDGIDLLEATEKRFGVTLDSEERGFREVFNLGPNEHLFHGEGFDLFPPFKMTTLFGVATDTLGSSRSVSSTALF